MHTVPSVKIIKQMTILGTATEYYAYVLFPVLKLENKWRFLEQKWDKMAETVEMQAFLLDYLCKRASNQSMLYIDWNRNKGSFD